MTQEAGRSPSMRDSARVRLTRMKRWLVGGAITLTGIFSAVAAHAVPARHAQAHHAARPSSPADESGAEQQATPALQPPPEAPQAAATGGGGAVSGGS